MEVPKETKKYTTTYSNFKGVDFTNDSTNVYKLRSPDAVNMVPNMDGSPRKRHGWKVDISLDQIRDTVITALGVVRVYADVTKEPTDSDWLRDSEGNVYGDLLSAFINGTYDNGTITDGVGEHYAEIWTFDTDTNEYELSYGSNIKTFGLKYFEIGGIDFILIFNSYGLFAYSSDNSTLRWITSKAFQPERSFFFEGKGTAGYYLFDGLDLYMFDGWSWYTVTPYYPITHIACAPNLSSATMYENVNMLTAYRRVQYMGDGTTTVFVLPVSATSTSTITVEALNAAGKWEEVTTGLTLATTQVTITPAPSPSTIDNVRITYKGSDVSNTVDTGTKTRPYQTVSLSKSGLQVMAKVVYTTSNGASHTVNGNWVDRSSSLDPSVTAIQSKTLAFDSSNIKVSTESPEYTIQYSNNGTATTLGSSYRSVSFGSYNSKLNVTVGKALYNSNIHTTSDSTSYGATKTGTKKRYNGMVNVLNHRDEIRGILTAYGFTNAQINTITGGTVKSVMITPASRTYKRTKQYKIRLTYTYEKILSTTTTGSTAARSAFQTANRVSVYGNGLINQVFVGAVSEGAFKNRIWYSGVTDPTYFPDLNYMEVGSNDTAIMGMMKVGEYLGVIKQGSSLDSSVYLAYPTSFNDDTTYAVKQKVAGVGAISNGAFNILNGEPLFLSSDGVMAIVPSENEERQLKNRSYYVNKRLLSEPTLENAVSFIWNNMYLLAVNNHVYALDGAQKTSWANERTNLQYECYYLENIPAVCFAKLDDKLYFADTIGNLCRFKTDDDGRYAWYDDYSADGEDPVTEELPEGKAEVTMDSSGTGASVVYDSDWEDRDFGTYMFKGHISGSNIANVYQDPENEWNGDWLYLNKDNKVTPTVGGHWLIVGSYNTHYVPPSDPCAYGYGDHLHTLVSWDGEKYIIVPPSWKVLKPSATTFENVVLATYGITITKQEFDFYDGDIYFSVSKSHKTITGYPIATRWSTIMDDDGVPQYFKNLQKKGTMVILTPSSDSGVTVSLKHDNKDAIVVGTIDVDETDLPFDYYTKKKVKKYKRLQFICENDGLSDSFGIDQIIKSYTIGNYSKSR